MARALGTRIAHLRRLWRLPSLVQDGVEQSKRAEAVAQGLQTQVSELRDELQGLQTQVKTQVSELRDELHLIFLSLLKCRALDKYRGSIAVETSHPVAYESPDHTTPWGTMRDNSTNERFIAKLIGLIGPNRMSLLDLGCSGGRQVRDVIMKGYLGIGIEGSDYSKSRLRAEWATIPEFLFTADITKRFTIKDGGGGCLRFGAVTLWEVMEHIRKSDLPPLMDNIDRHLAPGGIVIASISVAEEVIKGVALHQTVAHKEWWISELSRLGWTQHDDLVCYFGKDVVRGGENAPSSFHVVLSRTAEPLLGLKPNQPY